jgi:hypothetical protein
MHKFKTSNANKYMRRVGKIDTSFLPVGKLNPSDCRQVY